MRISYCTTCHKRLWQLKQTIAHNLAYTKTGQVELCILAYNDDETEHYLRDNYADYIEDGRLRVKTHIENKVFADGSRWSCGYVKDLAHKMATGRVLFNLDADNFIDNDLQATLFSLKKDEILITKQSEWQPDGRSGRIGVHHTLYIKVRYRDKGRSDDGDFIRRCIQAGAKAKQLRCQYKPIDNTAGVR
ncbi:hypothetical protein [Psychrobacter pygoscelis]|uniref:hypothetical protein n=1 Tax=Psychrobacter pygoscelis TaxID=2488563 RepID=UPI00103A132C|nr:hypothetical protein [Psychrobacter pygoscelis]